MIVATVFTMIDNNPKKSRELRECEDQNQEFSGIQATTCYQSGWFYPMPTPSLEVSSEGFTHMFTVNEGAWCMYLSDLGIGYGLYECMDPLSILTGF